MNFPGKYYILCTAMIFSVNATAAAYNTENCSYLSRADETLQKRIFDWVYPSTGMRPSYESFSSVRYCQGLIREAANIEKNVKYVCSSFPESYCKDEKTKLENNNTRIDELLKKASELKVVAQKEALQAKIRKDEEKQKDDFNARNTYLAEQELKQKKLSQHREDMDLALSEQCLSEVETIKSHDASIIMHWNKTISDLESAVKNENHRYAQHIYNKEFPKVANKPALLIYSSGTDECFKYTEYQKLESEIFIEFSSTEINKDKLEQIMKNSNNQASSIESTKKHNVTPKNKTDAKTGYFVESEVLFCNTKRQFDDQMLMLSQGHKNYASGCYSTFGNIDVVLIDFGVLGATEVRSLSNGKSMWITSESLSKYQ